MRSAEMLLQAAVEIIALSKPAHQHDTLSARQISQIQDIYIYKMAPLIP